MVAPLVTEFYAGGGITFLYGAPGVVPATPVGYIEKEQPLAVEAAFEENIRRSLGRKGPTYAMVKGIDVKLSGEFQQHNATLYGLVLGVTPSGQSLSIGGPNAVNRNRLSMRAIVNREDGTPIIFTSLYAMPTGNFSLPFQEGEYGNLPFEFSAMDIGDAMVSIDFDIEGMDATLATGVLTRVAGLGYHRVKGEGDLADALTDITAADLADGEVLRLQRYPSGAAITLTHATGTLELAGEANYVLDSDGKYIDLTYDLAGTKWFEIGRSPAE